MYKTNIRDALLSRVRSCALYDNNVSFAYKHIDGKVIVMANAMCYANLKRVSDRMTEFCIYIHPIKEQRKWQLDFIRWMLNESPWEHCFETKNAREAMDRGVYVDITKDGVHVYAAIIAMRQFAEYVGFRESYIGLRKSGYSPTVSYITSQFIYSMSTVRSWMNTSHSVLDWEMSIPELIKVFNKESQLRYLQQSVPFYDGVRGRVHDLIPKHEECCQRYYNFFNLEEKSNILELAEAVKKKMVNRK